ncbi:MAG TPA: hypothetical protein IAA24_04190 [Candidatus Eubacterium faecigallinarum]|nr:hypothetical protein [Candidatus Eubacterium faecigallinarum]
MRNKASSSRLCCLLAVSLILAAYVLQRIFHIAFNVTKELLIIEAILFSLASAVVMLLMTKTKESFYGILLAIFGLRMMPPDINGLELLSPHADILYFIVKQFSLLVFAVGILWFYEKQEKPKQIKALPILGTVLIVAFFMKVQNGLTAYFDQVAQGNMMYSYFSGFILYALAMMILLFIAVRSDISGAMLITDYQLVALALNFGRRVCAVAINLINGTHISRSYYCWLAIYVFFFAAFLALRIKKLKQQSPEKQNITQITA